MQVGYLFDHPGTVLFSVFMSFWAVTFLEYWKRKMATLAHHWDCMDFHEEEVSHSFLSHLLSVRKCLSRSAMYLILEKNRNSRSKPKGTGTNLKMGQTWFFKAVWESLFYWVSQWEIMEMGCSVPQLAGWQIVRKQSYSSTSCFPLRKCSFFAPTFSHLFFHRNIIQQVLTTKNCLTAKGQIPTAS